LYKKVNVGGVFIGGDAPISIQSMTNIPFSRYDELLKQAKQLKEAGCDILRVSVPDNESAELFSRLKREVDMPLVADIHFDYRLALASIKAGADKIRINPGNIGKEHIKTVADEAKRAGIPIRVGVNSGSLEKDILEKYGAPTAEALAESAMRSCAFLEECDFDNLVVAIKSSDVRRTVEAYREFDKMNVNRYPLHIGVTEAGTLKSGLIKNSVGIGTLLLDGIGSTIRYSLSASPLEEVLAAKILLRSLGLRNTGVEIVACPTCGRTTVNVSELADDLAVRLSDIKKPMKVAVMGCVVNGVGEAGDADIGVTGADGKYVVFVPGDGVKPKTVLKDANKTDACEFVVNYCRKNDAK